MFTVAHEKPDGSKDYVEVFRVRYYPATDKESERVECLAPPQEVVGVFIGALYGGTVYVMNDLGSTVATFKLEAKR